MSVPRLEAQARELLGSPRFNSAATLAIVGSAIFAEALQRLVGWPGYIAIVSCLVLIALGSVLTRRAEIEWQGLLPISLLVYIGWAGASIFWSQYQWSSLGGIAYLLAFTVLGVSIALGRDTIQIVRAFGDVLRTALGVSVVLEVFSGVLIDAPIQFLGIEGNLEVLGPLQGTMGSRNQFGLLALLAVVTFGIELATRSVNRGLAIGSLVVGGLCVLLSRSPVVFAVALVVGVALGALLLLRRVSPERRTTLQLSIVGIVIVAGVIAWSARSWIIALFSANSELAYRLGLWQELWDFIALNPLQGWGWVGYWRPEVQPFPVFAVAGEREPTSALNAYLDVWFQLGLVGAAIFAGLVVLTFTRSWLLAGRRRSIVFAWPALVLVVLLVTSLAESSMLVEYGWLIFVICCVKASQELSWRRAFAAPSTAEPGALGQSD